MIINPYILGAGDVVAPTVSSIEVENLTPNLITVHLSDSSILDAQIPSNGQWVISGAVNNPVVTSQIVDTTNKIVELFLSANILDDDTPLLTYVNPGDGTGIKDVADNFLASFANSAITNNIGEIPVFPGNDNLLWLLNLGVTGSTLEDKSGLNNDGALAKSHCATFTTSTVLTCTTSLAGITVTSNAGTATISISGNTIICSVGGTVFNVLLSNGSILPFAEGAGTQVSTDSATTALVFNVTGGSIDWTATQDTYHYNFKQGFSYYGRMATTNQYITLTTNLTPGTGRFSYKFEYSPDNITTTQDIAGTATTSTQLAIGTSAGAINGTMRVGSSATTYTISCADTAATVGWANNTFSVIIWSRDAVGNVTLTLNGFSLLMNGSASIVDTTSITISQFMRTSTANSNVGILKEIEILDTSDTTLIGQKYNAENSFRGTLQGGFTLVKYARPQGGDSTNRNLAGNWHNGAETRIKPNPSNNAAITTATGWDNTTELTYSQLDSLANPAFINITNPIRKRNLVVWETALDYEHEVVANNFVGKTTINYDLISGFTGGRYTLAHGSDIDANATAFTLKVVVKGVFSSSGDQLIYGKTDQIGASAVGWALVRKSGAWTFDIRNGSNVLISAPITAMTEIQTELSVIYVVIDNGQIKGGKDGFIENGSTALVGYTTTTQDTKVGAFSGGNAFTAGIVAIEIWSSKALTNAEVEADYQSTKNNVYHQDDDATELWTAEAGNANLVGKIGGRTLVKTGTITASSPLQVFNRRFRAEDMVTTTTKYPTPLANTSADLKIMFIGDSIFNGFGTTNALLRRTVLTQLQASSDMFNADMVGPYNVAPDESYTDNGATTGVILSGGAGFDAQFIAAAPTVVVLMLGANDAASSGAYNSGITDYNNLLFRIRDRLGYVPRTLVCNCIHIPTGALRNARAHDLNAYRLQVEWPDAVSKGNIFHYLNLYRPVTSYNADGVHPDDTGAIQMRDDSVYGYGVYNSVRLISGYDPE
jgi:lysophospholipase L1-like esterase